MMWQLPISTAQRLHVPLLLLVMCAAAACGGSADTSVTVGPSPTRCGVSVTADADEIPASGGGGTLTVTTSRECAWSARAEVPWISIATASGQGTATVNFSVVPNPNGNPRRGRVVVSEQAVEVAQAAAPCRYEVSPTSANVDASGSDVSIRVTAPDGCRWTARSDASWISNAAPAEGVGSGIVRVSVTPNTSQARSGAVTIADAIVRVHQSGRGEPPPPAPEPSPVPAPAPTPSPTPPSPSPTPSPTPAPSPQPPPPTPAPPPSPSCTYEVSRTRVSVSSTGEQVTVGVKAPDGCTWTAANRVSWIAISEGTSGLGNGSVRASVDPNTGSARTGTITVAGQTVTIEQAAPAPPPPCSYSLAPSTRNVGRAAEEFTVDVTTAAACSWAPASDAAWITPDTRTRTGNGSFRIAVSANSGGARTGTVRVASEIFTVHQAGGACTYTIKPTWYHAGRGPDDVRVSVTATRGCTWTAQSPVTWVTVAEGRDGSGDGTVRLLVDANSGPERTAQLTIAGHTFDLRQNGGCTASIKPTWYDAGRGPDEIRINVTAVSGCTWTASSTVSWVTVAEGASGSGDGLVRLLVEANSGPPRSVTLTIAGQPFALRQNGSQ